MTRLHTFACVGALGFAVQITVVAALTLLARWPPAAATAMGVEAAVLHNFVWHSRWTWHERVAGGAGAGARLLRFHLANGLTSIAGNVIISIALMRAGVNAVTANIAAVGVMSGANYVLADGWVFGTRDRNDKHGCCAHSADTEDGQATV